MFYLVKIPRFINKIFKTRIWQMPGNEKIIYLTFDDGPHPVATSFVLTELARYDAKATFFCIGKNVVNEPQLFNEIKTSGHAIGNHTHNHLNGWKTKDENYLADISLAKKHINSNLFRPPYGRITKSQIGKLNLMHPTFKTIMWTVLSGDFDIKESKEKCLENVLNNTGNGSIVVFHDSEKAFEKLKYTLPKVLEYFTEKGFRFERIGL